jgi:hypothetical protein
VLSSSTTSHDTTLPVALGQLSAAFAFPTARKWA